MTREEAIKILKVYRFLLEGSLNQDKPAFDLAIESLSADEVVRCKDCKNRVYDDSRDYYYCSMFYGQGDVSDENFCQWGERKEL